MNWSSALQNTDNSLAKDSKTNYFGTAAEKYEYQRMDPSLDSPTIDASDISHDDRRRLLSGGPRGMAFPQTIAHRGFQAQYPENTMLSFRGAVNVGADALETDLHITRDNVVVLSHDPTLTRCFGVEKRIRDCDYSYIRTLRTLRTPSQKMPTLKRLLHFMREPKVRHMWLLLDIKMDNDPDAVMALTAEALREVGRGGAETWGGRVVLGVWALKYVELCEKYLPGFPITHIGASIAYARQFLRIPGISFNLHHSTLTNGAGKRFMRDARRAGREVYTWTVNDNSIMKWSMCQHVLNGVCVDDPPEYVRVSHEYTPDWDNLRFWDWKKDMQFATIRMCAWLFVFLMRWKYCGGIQGVRSERELLQRQLQLEEPPAGTGIGEVDHTRDEARER